jgi:hypothetical protein
MRMVQSVNLKPSVTAWKLMKPANHPFGKCTLSVAQIKQGNQESSRVSATAVTWKTQKCLGVSSLPWGLPGPRSLLSAPTPHCEGQGRLKCGQPMSAKTGDVPCHELDAQR